MFPKRLLVGGPVMQSGWVEVRSVGPHERRDLTIDPNLVEQLQVAQRAVQFAGQNRSKVDRLFRGIVKTQAKRENGNDFERANAIDRVAHRTTYFKGSIGAGFRPSRSRCRGESASANIRMIIPKNRLSSGTDS